MIEVEEAKKSNLFQKWSNGQDICKAFTRADLQKEAKRLGLDSNGVKAAITTRIENLYGTLPDDSVKSPEKSDVNSTVSNEENVPELKSVETVSLKRLASPVKTEDGTPVKKRASPVPLKEADLNEQIEIDFGQVNKLRSAIDQFFRDEDSSICDFRCEIHVDCLPQISVGSNQYRVKYPVDTSVAAKVLYFASENGKEPSLVITSEQFSVDDSWRSLLESESSGLLEAIRKSLAPNVDKISARLHRLIIHKNGIAMPKDLGEKVHENQFGTLIFGLPGDFEGGGFILRQGTVMQKYNLKGKTFPRGIAFHACDSAKLEPVQSGISAILVYSLLSNEIPAPPSPSIGEADRKLMSQLKTLFDLPGVKSKTIGILLPNSTYPSHCRSSALTGKDLVAYNALIRSGLYRVRLETVRICAKATVREPIGTLARKCYREMLLERREMLIMVRRVINGSLPESALYASPEDDRLLMAKFNFPSCSNHQGSTIFLNDLTCLPYNESECSENIEPAGPGQISYDTFILKISIP